MDEDEIQDMLDALERVEWQKPITRRPIDMDYHWVKEERAFRRITNVYLPGDGPRARRDRDEEQDRAGQDDR